ELRRVRLLAGFECGAAGFGMEAVELEEEAVLAVGQESEHGQGALARRERAAREHLALAAEVFGRARERRERLGDVRSVEVGSDQRKAMSVHADRVGAP